MSDADDELGKAHTDWEVSEERRKFAQQVGLSCIRFANELGEGKKAKQVWSVRWAVPAVGSISIGEHIYQLGYDWRPDHYVEVTFDPSEIAYVCRMTRGKEKHFPVASLSKTELLAELQPFQFPSFQLTLPFS